MKVLLASFEPRRDRTPAGWRFVRKPTRHASSRQFESQPTETRGRYEHTLNARPDPPSGRSALPGCPGMDTMNGGRDTHGAEIGGREAGHEGPLRGGGRVRGNGGHGGVGAR